MSFMQNIIIRENLRLKNSNLKVQNNYFQFAHLKKAR